MEVNKNAFNFVIFIFFLTEKWAYKYIPLHLYNTL